MGAENIDLKATDASYQKKEEKKRKKKKREASSDPDLVTSLVADEISLPAARDLGLKAADASGRTKDEKKKKKKNRKREPSSDLDLVTSRNNVDSGDEVHDDDDLNEPTIAEKLASLNVVHDVEAKSPKKEKPSHNAKPPSADSVHVLLKHALHADDRIMLLDCLYTQDEKVIANSVSLLSPSDVLKLLDSLISLIQSRGAVLACALPWLRSLLLQHASGIMSQETSLHALNSLYQLIDSRISTFKSALELSSCLDYHFAGITEDLTDEMSTITPAIYEDKDESENGDEEDENEDAMETDQESEENLTNIDYSDDEVIM